MRSVSGVLLSIFSAILILVQGCFITWDTAYPEILFYIFTVASIICAITMFATGDKNNK